MRSGEKIELPQGYTFDRCLVYITNNNMKKEKAYGLSGRYFNDDDINKIHDFNTKYSTYWNNRPGNGKMIDLERGYWLHGEPLYNRVFFMSGPAPFSAPFTQTKPPSQMNTFSGCGITREGYFFYFQNDGHDGYYGEADVLVIAFW